jgi:ABC-2 type transport system permease protein
MYIQPFASMQNTPLLIYNGYENGTGILKAILLQIGWLAGLVVFGRVLKKNALKKVVVQGG